MAKNRGRRIDSIAALDMETMRPLFGFGAQHFGPIAKAMGVRFPSVQTNTFVGPLPANATETTVLVTPFLTTPLDAAVVFLFWTATLNPGTSTTNLLYRLRRGATTAGVQLGQAVTMPAVVGSAFSVSGCYFDTPGAVGPLQYQLSVVQTADTVAGVWTDGALLAFAL
jgi:hypothetical protein